MLSDLYAGNFNLANLNTQKIHISLLLMFQSFCIFFNIDRNTTPFFLKNKRTFTWVMFSYFLMDVAFLYLFFSLSISCLGQLTKSISACFESIKFILIVHKEVKYRIPDLK